MTTWSGLAAGARPISSTQPMVAAADGRLMVFTGIMESTRSLHQHAALPVCTRCWLLPESRFWIKSNRVDVEEMLDSSADAAFFSGASMAIYRCVCCLNDTIWHVCMAGWLHRITTGPPSSLMHRTIGSCWVVNPQVSHTGRGHHHIHQVYQWHNVFSQCRCCTIKKRSLSKSEACCDDQ